MTAQTTKSSGAEVAPGVAELAERLVDQARTAGVELTGPGGLLSGLTKQVLETALQVKMSDHLGYDRHDPVGRRSGNSRLGSTTKTLRTDIGDVEVAVSRDRAVTFSPVVLPKHRRRLSGFDDAVLSLYAKGMTTGDIAKHLADIYGTKSPATWCHGSPTRCSSRWANGKTGHSTRSTRCC